MTPLVLVHGGTFDSRCWDLMVPELTAPSIAVDLPGRGRRPAPLEELTFADCASAVVEDIDAAGFDEVVLVGHSMAGCTLPRAMALLGSRVRRAVFLTATVPAHGTSMVDALYEEYGGPDGEEIDFAALFAPETFRHRFGNDMDDDRYEWCASVRVPESTALSGDPVDLSGLDLPTPRVWVVATRDEMNRPDRQRRYAERVRPDRVLELDAGHMCMVSDPVGLAALLDELAAAV